MDSNNRDRLLDCALELFAARGYSSVGVQEIVSCAGVTKPTLYHYFGHKQGLLSALLREKGDALLAQLQSAAAYQGDLIRSLESLSGSWIQAATDSPALMSLLLNLSTLPPGHEARPLAAPLLGRLQQLLEELFSAAGPQHGNLRGHQTRLARSLLAQLHLTTLDVIDSRNDLAAKDALEPDRVHRLVKQYMYGIYSL